MNNPNFNPSYVIRRPDVEALLPQGVQSVLDVGCSDGTSGASIKLRTGARVVGIELMEDMGAIAKTRLDEVHIGDAQAILSGSELGDQDFDAIVFADVLEHVADPWRLLDLATARLRQGGAVIASIPNVRHFDTIFHLVVRGYWPYRDRGIHDRTHLRFFTKRNIEELMRGAGLKIDAQFTHYRIIERPHRWNRHARWLAWIPGLRPFIAFQYVTRAIRANDIVPQ